MVFQGLELAFRERVVVGDTGPAVGLLDPQLPQQLADLLRDHRAAPVAVDRQAARIHNLPSRTFPDQAPGNLPRFLSGKRVTHHITVFAG